MFCWLGHKTIPRLVARCCIRVASVLEENDGFIKYNRRHLLIDRGLLWQAYTVVVVVAVEDTDTLYNRAVKKPSRWVALRIFTN